MIVLYTFQHKPYTHLYLSIIYLYVPTATKEIGNTDKSPNQRIHMDIMRSLQRFSK